MAKYKSRKIEVDDIIFDSKAECDYYLDLQTSLARGLIKGFICQPKFTIQEKFNHPVEGNVRAIVLKADFLVHQLGEEKASLVIDVKGMATPVSKMKRKMFLKKYPEYELKWECKSIKYGVNGWIDYFELENIRKENRKKKEQLKKRST